jgi:hypothetical protein
MENLVSLGHAAVGIDLKVQISRYGLPYPSTDNFYLPLHIYDPQSCQLL